MLNSYIKKFKLCSVVFFFLFVCSRATASEFPKYKMMDLGILNTDRSSAWAVNNKGQVLGTCAVSDSEYLFLWDEHNGTKIIDFPKGCSLQSLKLNNNGQIAGVIHTNLAYSIFLWDSSMGFWQIDFSETYPELCAFNDNGQVLEKVNDKMFLWDHGKKIDLTLQFQEKVHGQWSNFYPVSINNHGHVIFNAHKNKSSQNDIAWGWRSFLWKDNSFTMIMPEKGWETQIQVVCMDDNGNMIIQLCPREGGNCKNYFISYPRNLMAFCNDCNMIRNALPLSPDRLPGTLKKDLQGNPYFAPGIKIKSLLDEEPPYYRVCESIEVRDQNELGYIIGNVDTVSGWHAFLAIPQEPSSPQ